MSAGLRSRRAFLKASSAAVAASALVRLPVGQFGTASFHERFPEIDEARLRELGLQAMDAVRAAGAAFGDVRLTAARDYSFICQYRRYPGQKPIMGDVQVGFEVRYGVRALVNGAWGFSAGYALETDAIVETARAAVEAARASRPRRRASLELAAIEGGRHGTWITPILQDPLTVPLRDQGDLGLAAIEEAIGLDSVYSAQVTFGWRRPTTVFAAMDDTVLVQRITQSTSSASVGARCGAEISDQADVDLELPVGGYGYEAMRGASLPKAMRDAGERAFALACEVRKARSVDVGRYDLVLSADVVAETLAKTAAGEALNFERALGYLTNGEGTTFVAPPADILGKYHIAAPLLTVRADRSRPQGAATVGWDDEGVKPDEYTVIRDGVVVDYHTNRETAMQLAGWYGTQGETVRSRGCARRGSLYMPVILVPNLTIEPAKSSTTVADLVGGTSRGFYVERTTAGGTDQQVLNTQYAVRPAHVREIRGGKLGGYVKDVAFQFITPQFWKNVDALGGAASTRAVPVVTDIIAMFDPMLPFVCSTVQAVPARVRNVNVLNTGRTR